MQQENVLMGITGVALGAGIGAGLMYLLDPERGNRRRALVRDQLVHAKHKTGDVLRGTTADFGNRSKGLVHELRRKVRSEEVDARTLEARVRSELGRLVANPSAVEVSATDQEVTLTGPVLREEVETLLSGVSSVPGVRDVRNRLDVHDSPGDVSALQGSATVS